LKSAISSKIKFWDKDTTQITITSTL